VSGNDEAPRTRAPEAPFRLPFVAGVDIPFPTLLIEVLQQQKLPAGLVACEDNPPGEARHLAMSGRVQGRKTPDSGQEPLFAELEPSEGVSVMALLEETPGSARVLTLVATLLLAMSRQTVSSLIGSPLVEADLLKGIGTRDCRPPGRCPVGGQHCTRVPDSHSGGSVRGVLSGHPMTPASSAHF
jgi:hypothetical protein